MDLSPLWVFSTYWIESSVFWCSWHHLSSRRDTILRSRYAHRCLNQKIVLYVWPMYSVVKEMLSILIAESPPTSVPNVAFFLNIYLFFFFSKRENAVCVVTNGTVCNFCDVMVFIPWCQRAMLPLPSSNFFCKITVCSLSTDAPRWNFHLLSLFLLGGNWVGRFGLTHLCQQMMF